MFVTPPAEVDIPILTRLRHEADTTASLEVRARSFIDANCAHCHRPGGVQALFDARFDTPLASQGLVGGTVGNLLGIAGAKEVPPECRRVRSSTCATTASIRRS